MYAKFSPENNFIERSEKSLQIKHLTLSNIVPTCAGITFSIKPLFRARDGHRPQAVLDLEIDTAELLSVARLVYEVLNEDVVELQFGIDWMKSIVDPKAPKLVLDLLELGKFTRLAAFFEMSQRIQHIERWVAPYLTDYKEGDMDRKNYVLNMPFTTFGEINIDSTTTRRYIVKLSTGSKTTFLGVSLRRDEKLPTEDDYYDQKDEKSLSIMELFYSRNNELGKVTIVCADVKRLKVGRTLINIEN